MNADGDAKKPPRQELLSQEQDRIDTCALSESGQYIIPLGNFMSGFMGDFMGGLGRNGVRMD